MALYLKKQEKHRPKNASQSFLSGSWLQIFLLVGALPVFGEHPASDAVPDPWSPSNPNHLEPIPAYHPHDGHSYNQAVFRSLIGDKLGELWMIGRPSFAPEYAVVLRHEVNYDESTDPFSQKYEQGKQVVETGKWIVEYVEAKEQIWRWKETGDGRLSLDIRETSEVIRHQSEITKEFSAMIFAAWKNVLRRTRYPDEDYRGLDGATFEFYCRYNLFGETWTPSTGLPYLLTELGHKLAEVAMTQSPDREKAMAECIDLVEKIDAEIHKLEQDDTNNPPESGS